MNPTEHDIENCLRHAPAPAAPAALRDRLIDGINLNSRPQCVTRESGTRGFWQRWWPGLVPGAASVACAVALSLQQFEITQLKQTIASLAAAAQEGTVHPEQPTQASPSGALDEVRELERLRGQVVELRKDVSATEALLADNQQLRKQLATPVAGLSQDEVQALQEAREKAMAITCVNNLKQIGLAARIWAVDHKDIFPPSMEAMSQQLSTPKILACPADPQHPAAADWSSYTPANCSYEFLMPNGTYDGHPNAVAFRCATHGTIGLADGSVQMGMAKSHPEWLIQKDGLLQFVVPGR